MAEVAKCVLICNRCHGEVHAGLVDCPVIDHKARQINYEAIQATRPIPLTRQVISCPCGNKIPGTKKFCSQECVHRAQARCEWPDDYLKQKDFDRVSAKAIARKLGISDKAVAKRDRLIVQTTGIIQNGQLLVDGRIFHYEGSSACAAGPFDTTIPNLSDYNGKKVDVRVDRKYAIARADRFSICFVDRQ